MRRDESVRKLRAVLRASRGTQYTGNTADQYDVVVTQGATSESLLVRDGATSGGVDMKICESPYAPQCIR